MELDKIWERDEVDSPCVKICVIHPPSGLCIGCFRTTDEIAGWSDMTPGDRKILVAELPDREKLIVNRRKKRGLS
ncbi:MAG: DUF1289 domain-containing protein [Rhodobacteraceae bacterium]|nr:MAG: DUF1289 domain-containing protein [Paracoccaceae bacterium]